MLLLRTCCCWFCCVATLMPIPFLPLPAAETGICWEAPRCPTTEILCPYSYDVNRFKLSIFKSSHVPALVHSSEQPIILDCNRPFGPENKLQIQIKLDNYRCYSRVSSIAYRCYRHWSLEVLYNLFSGYFIYLLCCLQIISGVITYK